MTKKQENYIVHVTFSDGVSGVLDFSEYVGKGVFSQWREYDKFQAVRIGEFGELVWDDDLDFCADSLYLKVTGQKPEEYFKSRAGQHA